MIKRQVVLILGAGASKPYGFPLGKELFNLAVGDCPDDLYDLIGTISLNQQDLTRFQSELRRSLLPSVDAFLETHKEYLEIGKAIIAYFLIKCEQENKLYNTSNNENWYEYLYTMMRPDSLNEFSENKISFITFNYDRSLEYCLFNALKAGWPDTTDHGVAEVLGRIPIIHVHGTLGELIQLSPTGRPFDGDVHNGALRIAMEGIRVVHENLDEEPAFTRAHEVLAKSENVIFFGFGYHPMNVQRLQLDKHLNQNAQIRAIVRGRTGQELEYDIKPLFEKRWKDSFLRVKNDMSILTFLRTNINYFIKE